ncbi:CYFA0S06e00980g1_1 [Cyberlindnera fabianii]|uniref:Nuclear distribution protein PAC1 n=1 Tax=Cyberlindnera fabianii TaxID=36022 RepID=A0A061B242_CYBFA|nr:CYFA0S06e00980g1_1 [Cyberlindnera fabianii]
MSFLSERQRSDLHNSLLNYLKPIVSDQTLEQLRTDLNVSNITDDNDLLPKKWTAILRLQKKITDLESQVQQLSKQSHNSSSLVANGDSELTKFNWAPSKVKKTLNNNSTVTTVAIHPKLPQLINGCSDGTFSVWNLLDLVQPLSTIQAHTRAVNAVAISPAKLEFNNNNHVVVTCGSDLYVKVWDLHTGRLIRTLTGHEHVVSSVVFKTENVIFTASRDTTIKIWDIKSGWCLKSFVGHSDWVRTLDLTASEYLLSGSSDQSVRLSHGDSGTGLGLMIGHNQVVETVKFVPMISNKYVDKLNTMEDVNKETYNKLGFKYAVTGGRDDTIKIWLLPVPIIRPHNHPIPSSNPQGTLVKTLIGHKSWVKDLAFHPNGKILVSCSDDKSIKLWDLETGDCVRTLTGHDGFINSIAWAPSIFENDSDKLTDDEEMINDSMRCVFASGGTDQLVKIWD